MQVIKFGGTSVANSEHINKAFSIVREAVKNEPTIVVLSALGGMTDLLIQCGQLAAEGDESYKERLRFIEQRHLDTVKSLLPLTQQSSLLSLVKRGSNEMEDICNGVFMLKELSARTKDKIVSFGELLSSQIFSAGLAANGMENLWKDTRELIVTDSQFGAATVDFSATNQRISNFFQPLTGRLFACPGFIASDHAGVTTTLGRGGSDYSAAIIAAAIDAKLVEIWTDVSGMMTADPRLVPNVRSIPRISYQEAMELSHFGAKVIYPPTIQPLMSKGIPVWIKNTFFPNEVGTIICKMSEAGNGSIRGISSISHIALLSLEGSGMVGTPGFSKRLFEALASEKINVILITQSSSEHSICVAIDDNNVHRAKVAVDKVFDQEIKTGSLEPLIIEKELAIIALVGDNMKSHPGISGKMFGAWGRNGVNVRAIAQGSSERNISAVVATSDVKKAVNILHEEFFEATFKQLNLFIIGTGNVGSRLLDQLKQQEGYLEEHLRLQVKVVGLANSKTMTFKEEGVDPGNWLVSLKNGEPMNLDNFVQVILAKNLRNTVIADITANSEVAKCYDKLLQKSISVVACNKLACSSTFVYYKKLKDLAREFNSLFLFETNVGAGLPVIGTLNDLLRSGDKVNKIEAVLSGTLNFVFNHYRGERTFSEIVKQAQQEGYTEPDPRLDLSGSDVMRKIMILAREAGAKMEMDEITNHTFMPASCMAGTVENFYSAMTKEENHFKKLYEDAASDNKILKFVAKFENGKASTGLQHIGPKHDFYHLYGKDNVVLLYTDRYPEQPLVIKGAGAGAEVTASGVFADIIRAARV